MEENIDYEKFAGFIRGFPKQFEFEPKVENMEKLGKYENFIMCGMGGSALAADLLRAAYFDMKIKVWRDYGLPVAALPKDGVQNILVIASSYSGNTEETIDGFNEAIKRKLPVAVVATAGKLLDLAIQQQVPYVQLPNTGIQPRISTGFSIRAILKLMGDEAKLAEIRKLSMVLDVSAAEKNGEALAQKLQGFIPIIYTSNKNFPIAYNWKIKFNETGKIPAFANCVPELNHNEMTGLDIAGGTRDLSKNFYFIFLEDPDDDPRILKRMAITKKLLEDRGFPISDIQFLTSNIWHKIFQNLLIADWAAFYLAKFYGVDPEQVPMVEEFKKTMNANAIS